MPNNLWCAEHRKMVYEGKPTDEQALILAARLMAEFSQHPSVQATLYHDPFFSELHQEARFIGVVALTKCICCVLGDEAVKGIVTDTFDPQSKPAKETVIV